MYKTYKEFWADHKLVRLYYETFSANIPWMAAPYPERGWDIYQQALNVEYGVLVMGRTGVDEKGPTPEQFGWAIGEDEHKNLGVITHSDEEAQVLMGKGISGMSRGTGGMIMHYYGGVNSKWRGGKAGYHFLYNDAWLLAGAHGRHDFNLASPRWPSNLWDNKANRFTATGREVTFLGNHGYKIVTVGASGLEVFHCADPLQATKASLPSLVSTLKGVISFKQIEHLSVPEGTGKWGKNA